MDLLCGPGLPALPSWNWFSVDCISKMSLRFCVLVKAFDYFCKLIWNLRFSYHLGSHLKITVSLSMNNGTGRKQTLCCYCWVNIASVLVFLSWIFSKVFLLRKATVIWSLKSILFIRMLLVVVELLHLSFCSSWVCLSPISCLVFFVVDWISICCYTILQPFFPTISFLSKTFCSPLLSAGVWPHFLQDISFCFSSAL